MRRNLSGQILEMIENGGRPAGRETAVMWGAAGGQAHMKAVAL